MSSKLDKMIDKHDLVSRGIGQQYPTKQPTSRQVFTGMARFAALYFL